MPWVTTTIHDIFNVYFRNQTFTSPGDVFLGIATDATVPQPDGTGFSEVTSAQLGNPTPVYARQPITFGAPSARTVINSTACLFTSSANPPANFNVRYGGIFAAVTGGIPMAYGPLASPLLVVVGALVSIPAGQLTITDPGTP